MHLHEDYLGDVIRQQAKLYCSAGPSYGNCKMRTAACVRSWQHLIQHSGKSLRTLSTRTMCFKRSVQHMWHSLVQLRLLQRPQQSCEGISAYCTNVLPSVAAST